MPQIDEIQYDKVRGKNYKWIKCPNCGKERWVEAWHHKRHNSSDYCRSCAQTYHRYNRKGEQHPKWKGGRINARHGYVGIKIALNDPFYVMANANGYIHEHRLVMARALDRVLMSNEIVHHLNGIKTDNRLENLALTSRPEHEKHTYIKLLQRRIRELE